MVATLVIHVITWITTHLPYSASEMAYIVSGGALNSTHSLTHLPTPNGWKAELAWLVDPSKHFTR